MNATLYDPSDVAFGAQPRLVCAGCGATFTGRGSHQPITFPYSPDRIYLDVDGDGKPLNGWNRDGVYADWLKEEKQ